MIYEFAKMNLAINNNDLNIISLPVSENNRNKLKSKIITNPL